MKIAAILGLAAVLAAGATAANADPIPLSPASIIGSSGNYTSGPTNFLASSIADQQTGPVSDVFNANTYWINSDNGPANAYITIDLGAGYVLDDATLFNTHNGPYGDRGTGDFTIIGSNSIIASAGGYVLDGATTLVFSGTLAAAPVSDPITGQDFASLSNDTFRYLEFLPTSVATANTPCCGSNVYGLNELRLSGEVPEPASWTLMLVGLIGLGGLLYRRRSAV